MPWRQRGLGSERQPGAGAAGPPGETSALEPQRPPRTHGHAHGPGEGRQPRAELRRRKAEAPALQTTLWLSLEKHVGPRVSLTQLRVPSCSAHGLQRPALHAHRTMPGSLSIRLPGQSPPASAGSFPCQKPCGRTDTHLHHGRGFSTPPGMAPVTPLTFGMCTLNAHHSLWGQVCD